MAIPAVSVYLKIRVRDPETGETKPMRVSAVWSKNHSLKPFVGLVNGKEEHHPEGTYLLRYGGKWEFVGKAIDLVLSKKREREKDLREPKPVQTIVENGPRILEALNEYCAIKSQTNLKTGQRALARKTIEGYRTVVEAFIRISGKTYMKEITAEDLLSYFAAVRTQGGLDTLDPADENYDERIREVNNTVHNHFATLCAFFNYHKIDLKTLLRKDEIPVYIDRDPEAYTEDEISRMWAVAKPEEKIRLQFFVSSGFRRGEVSNLRWDHIDLWSGRVVTYKKTKTHRVRTVTLPDFLVEALRKRLAQVPVYDGNALVFPSKRGFVCYNQMLVMLKRVAKRAGVTCERVDLHKFRSTCASLMQDEDVSIDMIQGRLGHTSQDMTRRYLRAMNQRTERARQQANEVFGKLA